VVPEAILKKKTLLIQVAQQQGASFVEQELVVSVKREE
jgi:hypothetical protein